MPSGEQRRGRYSDVSLARQEVVSGPPMVSAQRVRYSLGQSTRPCGPTPPVPRDRPDSEGEASLDQSVRNMSRNMSPIWQI